MAHLRSKIEHCPTKKRAASHICARLAQVSRASFHSLVASEIRDSSGSCNLKDDRVPCRNPISLRGKLNLLQQYEEKALSLRRTFAGHRGMPALTAPEGRSQELQVIGGADCAFRAIFVLCQDPPGNRCESNL